jgi:hypothetical protein
MGIYKWYLLKLGAPKHVSYIYFDVDSQVCMINKSDFLGRMNAHLSESGTAKAMHLSWESPPAITKLYRHEEIPRLCPTNKRVPLAT